MYINWKLWPKTVVVLDQIKIEKWKLRVMKLEYNSVFKSKINKIFSIYFVGEISGSSNLEIL